MSPSQHKNVFPLGLVLFVLALAIYKAAMLADSMMLDWHTLMMLAGLDFLYFSMFLLIAIVLGFTRPGVWRMFLWSTLVFMSSVYLIDSFVLLELDEHAPLFDIGRYSLEPGVVLSFFDARAYIAIFLLLVSIFIYCAFSPAAKRLAFVCLLGSFSVAGFCSYYAPQPLIRYAILSPAGILEGFRSQPVVSSYSAEQIAFYASLEQEPIDIPESKPDIILLVIESLSSINSKRTSGNSGFLEGFDKLAEEGTLFRNFFANHQASEGGLIALLSGYPPMHFPTATPYMFDEFADQASLISAYRQSGYFTEFLTNSDLSFIGLNRYLEGLGLDRKRGRDEVFAMRDAPRVVLNSPSDALLYNEALMTVRQLSSDQRPFLLTIATTSTHLPYTHPEGGPDTPEAVWQWSQQQLLGFYKQLYGSGYFKHGILLITGDHRQMRPLTAVETARYGDSARARVPLLVIGTSYSAGAIDTRFFQQSDLLRMLGKIQQAEAPLSPQPIWVERYNRKYGRIELIDRLSIFDEADLGRREYRLKAPGNQIEWLGKKPQFSRRLETLIHAQRSLHQWTRYNIRRRTDPVTEPDSG